MILIIGILTTLICLFSLLIFIISTKKLNAPFIKDSGAFIYYHPYQVPQLLTEYPLLEIIVVLYKNCIFDYMYYRVEFPGKYFKYYSFIALKVIFCRTFLTILYVTVQTLKFFILPGNKIKYYQFLYLNYNNTYDIRKLMFINND